MRIPTFVQGAALALALLQAGPALGQAAAPAALLTQEIAERSALMQNLEELCDGFGPRLTGSAQLRAAQAWAMARLTSYGAVNVHEEAYELGRPWQRGMARARLLNASGMALDIVQQAWTEGTPGVVRGEVAILNVTTLAEFSAAVPALKGKIVLVVSGPSATQEQRKDMARYRAAAREAVDAAQFAAVLMVSDKEGGLRDMFGAPDSRFKRSTGILTKEHAHMLQRLAARGIVPKLEIEMSGGFGKQPVKAYNVVADIVGSEAPQEMVIVGAHQDSWDLSTGATDNGAGTVVMMEILRAMQASGLKPKRTLRVVLFSGEEQGLLGSKAYVAAHRAELANIQAVIVQDAGAGRVTGFPDMKVEDWYGGLAAAVEPAKALGPLDIVYGISNGSDHVSFFEEGIPSFAPTQDVRDYLSTIHSQIDSVDHVSHADLKQGAQVLAITAWGLLNSNKLPHQPRKQ